MKEGPCRPGDVGAHLLQACKGWSFVRGRVKLGRPLALHERKKENLQLGACGFYVGEGQPDGPGRDVCMKRPCRRLVMLTKLLGHSAWVRPTGRANWLAYFELLGLKPTKIHY